MRRSSSLDQKGAIVFRVFSLFCSLWSIMHFLQLLLGSWRWYWRCQARMQDKCVPSWPRFFVTSVSLYTNLLNLTANGNALFHHQTQCRFNKLNWGGKKSKTSQKDLQSFSAVSSVPVCPGLDYFKINISTYYSVIFLFDLIFWWYNCFTIKLISSVDRSWSELAGLT